MSLTNTGRQLHADEIEDLINYQALKLATSKKREDRVDAWDELQRLHKLRRPEKVKAMEASMRANVR